MLRSMVSLHASLHVARSLARPPHPTNYSDVATVELAEGNMASFVSDMERTWPSSACRSTRCSTRRGGAAATFERRLALTKVPELIVDGKFKDFREAALRGVDAQIDGS